MTFQGVAEGSRKKLSFPTDAERQRAAKTAYQKYLGVNMICGAERGRYGNLLEGLQKCFTKGNDYYPEDLMDTYTFLLNYKTLHSKLVSILVGDSEEVLF